MDFMAPLQIAQSKLCAKLISESNTSIMLQKKWNEVCFDVDARSFADVGSCFDVPTY